MTDTCSNCKFFRAGKIINGPGACRRNPPMPMLMPTTTGGLAIQGSFAPVGPSDWCGEHRRNYSWCSNCAQKRWIAEKEYCDNCGFGVPEK